MLAILAGAPEEYRTAIALGLTGPLVGKVLDQFYASARKPALSRRLAEDRFGFQPLRHFGADLIPVLPSAQRHVGAPARDGMERRSVTPKG